MQERAMTQPSVKKNYIYKTIYEVFYLLTPFITIPYVSRILGADLVGVYSYTHSMVMYFAYFGSLGTVSYGAREIAKARDDRAHASKVFWEIEILSMITCSISIIGWIGFILASKRYALYYLAHLPLLISTMFNIVWIFQGYEQMGRIVLRDAFIRIAGIVFLFVFVKTRDDLVNYILVQSCTQMRGNLSMWLYLPKMLEPVDFRSLRIKRHLKDTLIYFIPVISTSIYTVLDKTLLGAITKDPFQNGYYEQAAKAINLVKTFTFNSVNAVMGARIAYLFGNGSIDEIKRRIDRSINYMFFVGYACVFGMVAISKVFVPVFFGEGYEPVALIMNLMTPLVIIISISSCLDHQYFSPSGQKEKAAGFIIVGAVCNLIMNLLLIPRLKAVGAVIGSLVAEVVISALFLSKSKDYMTLGMLLRYSWKRIISGMVMLAGVIYLGRLLGEASLKVLLIQVMRGVAIYVSMSFFLKDDMLKYVIDTVLRVIGLKRSRA